MLPLLLAACKARGIEIISGPNADVTLTVVNPTTCSNCDPLDEVDALRLDVIRHETSAILASTTVAWPGELPSLPDLDGFGVVRAELTGLNGSRIMSVGRTAPFVVQPGTSSTISMLFLPANRAIPLTGELSLDRSRHVAYTRLDGRITLIGGVDPTGNERYDSTEVYDPLTHTFALDAVATVLPIAPAVAVEQDGDLLLVGGASSSGSRLSNTWVYALGGEGEQGTLTAQNDLSSPHSGGCIGLSGPQKGAVMGGVDTRDGPSTVDIARFGATAWTFEAVSVQGLDNRDVRGCVGVGGDRVFVLGKDGGSTGFFSYPDEGAVAFAAIGDGSGEQFVASATVIARDGDAWIVGGVTDEGEVQAQTWVFDTTNSSFRRGGTLAQGRTRANVAPWIDPLVEAVGCGWSDSGETSGSDSVELVDLHEGTLLEVPLDRERPGCSMSVLADGALLIAGGFGLNDVGQVSAVLVVPAF
ncbi:MAG: hypothetical protein EXR69_04720 [Myxococcales bacterium]|nr:hypothetical protein [Myxococcales bacterium]